MNEKMNEQFMCIVAKRQKLKELVDNCNREDCPCYIFKNEGCECEDINDDYKKWLKERNKED